RSRLAPNWRPPTRRTRRLLLPARAICSKNGTDRQHLGQGRRGPASLHFSTRANGATIILVRPRSLLVTATFLVLVHAPGVARASGNDPAAAEALFREGRAAAQKGDWETACPKLRESQRLDPAAGTLLNLADCEEHRGKVATAWQLYRQVVESLPETDERVP